MLYDLDFDEFLFTLELASTPEALAYRPVLDFLPEAEEDSPTGGEALLQELGIGDSLHGGWEIRLPLSLATDGHNHSLTPLESPRSQSGNRGAGSGLT